MGAFNYGGKHMYWYVKFSDWPRTVCKTVRVAAANTFDAAAVVKRTRPQAKVLRVRALHDDWYAGTRTRR